MQSYPYSARVCVCVCETPTILLIYIFCVAVSLSVLNACYVCACVFVCVYKASPWQQLPRIERDAIPDNLHPPKPVTQSN